MTITEELIAELQSLREVSETELEEFALDRPGEEPASPGLPSTRANAEWAAATREDPRV